MVFEIWRPQAEVKRMSRLSHKDGDQDLHRMARKAMNKLKERGTNTYGYNQLWLTQLESGSRLCRVGCALEGQPRCCPL